MSLVVSSPVSSFCLLAPFFFFKIDSNKSFIHNCIDNGVEIYRSEAAFFFNKWTLKACSRSLKLQTGCPGSWTPGAPEPALEHIQSGPWVYSWGQTGGWLLKSNTASTQRWILTPCLQQPCSAGLPHTFWLCQPYFSTSVPSSVRFFAVHYWANGEKGQLLSVRQTLAFFLQP